jgi:hypothetical protein
MSYPITDIDGIDGDVAVVLKSVGIRSTDRLLESARTVKGRKALAEKTGFDERQLLYWANVADRMRIKGVRKEYAELLQAAGVDTVKELKYRNPGNPPRRWPTPTKRKLVVCFRRRSGQALIDTKLFAAEDHLLTAWRLTAPRRPRKATGMGSAVPSETGRNRAKICRQCTFGSACTPPPLVMGIPNVTPILLGWRLPSIQCAMPVPPKWRNKALTFWISARVNASLWWCGPVSADDERRDLPGLAGRGQARLAGINRHHQGFDRRLGPRRGRGHCQ